MSQQVRPGAQYLPGNGQGTPRDHTGQPTEADPSEVRDVVTVRMPADSAYLSVLRTATAGLAARLDFTLDEIEDLRIGVDEACAMLLAKARPGTDLSTEFELTGNGMRIAVSVRSDDGRLPERDTFAWTVLSALAGDVDAYTTDDNRITILLHKHRADAESA